MPYSDPHNRRSADVPSRLFGGGECPTLPGFRTVVELLSKRWWIPVDARLEGLKLELDGQRAEVGFPAADLGLSSIQRTLLFGSYGI